MSAVDISQAEHCVTAKGHVEISGSPTLVSTTGLLHCTTQWLLKLLILGDCSGLSLFNDDHPPFNGRSRDRFPVVSLDFSVTYFLPTVPWSWVHSVPSENEYQEHSWG